MPPSRPYVVIAGSGRSGTNRLLDAFDLHPQTVCRSETEEMTGGDFAELPGATRFEEPLGEGFEGRWTRAVARARRRQSARDRIDAMDKTYYAGRPMARPVQRLLASRTIRRKVLGRVAPRLREREWDRPMFCTDAAALDAALLVLKIRPPAWLLRTHAGDPDQLVLHQIREPRAYLNSWYNRWVVQGSGGEQVFRESMVLVPHLLADFGEDPARFAEYSEERLVESQMWIWRHLNETLHLGLRDSPRYRVVNYDAFDRAPVEEMEALLGFCGLPAPAPVLEKVGAMRNTLFGAHKGGRLDPELCERVIARVLDGSPLPDLLARTA
ncbi:sulfotransferase domain-containing protein [Albimonas pacifica]|uniref:Sulfotransferase domain-containing protein n=1 Tax=Albimonas pacifica TaxID=1114924 RepID=A0A1I3IL01_9RHOB|nr:sulfotransferase domain-containing protein [Albimonas pacifica]SFI48549.1 Sulfotransferase domain-containing protein [Albimonas pacifica]